MFVCDGMKEIWKNLLLAMLISGILIFPLVTYTFYTSYILEIQRMEELIPKGETIGGTNFVDDFLQTQLQINLIGVVLVSITWFGILTTILFFVISWIRKRRK
jgi:hypothetical protein